MVKIYNTCRLKKLNMVATMQLKLEVERERFLSMNSLGESKGCAESCAIILLIRRMFADEYTGESKEIKVFDIIDGQQKIIPTDPLKDYYVIFIAKNREGSKRFQVVAEVDFNRSTIKEIGYCCVSNN